MKARNAAVRLLLGVLGLLMIAGGLGMAVPPTISMWREVSVGLLVARNGGGLLGALAFCLVGGTLLCEALRPGPPRFLRSRRTAQSPNGPKT